ncbi:MAG: F0F1 ATP synthase subunit gamma [Candidatus Saccharimonadia bacterium]
MKRALMIQNDVAQIGTIEDLTSVFEGIASLRIAKIKDKVVLAKSFFGELWQIYTQLRVDPIERLSIVGAGTTKNKNVFVAVTSEGSLSGDIDAKIIERVKADFHSGQTDVIVLGSHGATLLQEAKIPFLKGYRLPDADVAPDVRGIIAELRSYKNASVYYQTYVSLGVQEAAKIDLISAVKAFGVDSAKSTELISSRDYIFEPSVAEIVTYMEAVVLEVTLGQAILESRLAQYASRFTAMTLAKQRAKELGGDLLLDYRRAKRAESDERLKEVMTSLELLT